MNRRDFLKRCLAAGIGVGMAGLPFAGGMAAGEIGEAPDLIADRNGEPEQMFDSGIAAMGGMRRFVKPGQVVAIKPNVSWDVPVDMAGNTNPGLINRIARHCLDAGARQVLVFDNCIEYWQRCYDASGIRAAALDAGARIAPAETERYYVKRDVGGRVLKTAQIHEAVLNADVLISAPILKHHGGAGMTAGLKNFMGAVWDRRFYHANGLSQCIAEFMLVRKPDLTVLDAYRVLTGNGPRSRNPNNVQLMKMQILSTDPVIVDAMGARLMGRQPEDFEHVRLAHTMGFGQLDPALLRSRRISL